MKNVPYLNLRYLTFKQCALPPFNRREQTQRMVRAIQLHAGGTQNEWLKGIGTRITNANLSVSYVSFKLPSKFEKFF